MKDMSIRQKMIPIYLVISVFTFLLFFVAFFIMRGLVSSEAEQTVFRWFIIAFPAYLVVYFVCIFMLGRTIAKQVAYPAKALAAASEQIALGDIDVELTHRAKDELGVLTEKFLIMVDGIRQQAEVLQTVAGGDYTASIPVRSEKDVVNKAIAELLANNNHLVLEIRKSAQQVTASSQQVAQSAQALSQGSTQQAASVQEFSATLSEVMGQSDNNAVAAQKALDVTRRAEAQMEDGVRYMQQVQQAMAAIDESSRQITGVIKVIEDIAFQTNILALNAAVEAARAGVHGKGFAVVADEVRSLAGKSAEAAKQTTDLIENSRESVATGSTTVEKTGQALKSMAGLTAETLGLVQAIASDSESQSQSIAQVHTGIDQISQVVQANSATAEQSAAASEEMSAQAGLLDALVSRFRLKEAGRSLPPRRH